MLIGERIAEGVAPATDSAKHLFDAGGKRVRPMALLLAHACWAPINDKARGLAAAAELVHMATLLHDDVIDDGDTRRGRRPRAASGATPSASSRAISCSSKRSGSAPRRWPSPGKSSSRRSGSSSTARWCSSAGGSRSRSTRPRTSRSCAARPPRCSSGPSAPARAKAAHRRRRSTRSAHSARTSASPSSSSTTCSTTTATPARRANRCSPTSARQGHAPSHPCRSARRRGLRLPRGRRSRWRRRSSPPSRGACSLLRRV